MTRKSKSWCVSVPFTGFVTVIVGGQEPVSRDDALDRALQVMEDEGYEGTATDSVELGELEYHETVCKGNVLHAVLNTIEWEPNE